MKKGPQQTPLHHRHRSPPQPCTAAGQPVFSWDCRLRPARLRLPVPVCLYAGVSSTPDQSSDRAGTESGRTVPATTSRPIGAFPRRRQARPRHSERQRKGAGELRGLPVIGPRIGHDPLCGKHGRDAPGQARRLGRHPAVFGRGRESPGWCCSARRSAVELGRWPEHGGACGGQCGGQGKHRAHKNNT